MTEVRQLNQVERGVEEALRIFAGQTENRAPPAPDMMAVERIDRIGSMSGLAIVEACETTAKDIEQAGQAAMDVAADILRESRQLATKLRANAKLLGEHLSDFAVLANKVSAAMRNTRSETFKPSNMGGNGQSP